MQIAERVLIEAEVPRLGDPDGPVFTRTYFQVFASSVPPGKRGASVLDLAEALRRRGAESVRIVRDRD